MKWISHKLTTFAIYYTLSGDLIQSLIASASSILPDAIEIGPGRAIFRKHRGVSHNPLLWFFALAVLFCLFRKRLPDTTIVPVAFIPGPEALFLAIATGVTLHLIADALSGSGIPLLGNKKIALKLYKTFTPALSHSAGFTLSEFAVVSFVLLSCGISFALVRFLLT
ncbi:MAG: metal-dependent hydrolase [Deltaproteobacteria bacterium]|nr:metal-dependent hydrolase [Deltaproteobacteria bacterium]